MNEIGRHQVPPSTQLLMRILERPGLVAAVRELPGGLLSKLIETIGLEDAGELLALASTAQLERVFDDHLWGAERAGGDETFRPERFALWLRVMSEAGDASLARRLCELPRDLVALAVHRLVLVVDIDLVEEQLAPCDKEAVALERALDNALYEEWEELRMIARDPDTWDDVWGALLALDRDHHDRLRAILERCCDMTLEYISGQGGLYQVLTADEMLDSDVAAARDDRRAAEGFISPADARAFLELARRGDGGDERDAITRAYFRALPPPKAVEGRRRGAIVGASDRRDLEDLLREAEVIAPQVHPLAALPAAEGAALERSHVVVALFEQALRDLRERDPEVFGARVREIGYLVNVWIAGGAHEGRRPRPAEAMELVLATCEAGLRAQLGPGAAGREAARAAVEATPGDRLFRRGFGAGGRDDPAPR